LLCGLLALSLLSACQPASAVTPPTLAPTAARTSPPPSPTATPFLTRTSTAAPAEATPTAIPTPRAAGPDAFPEGINPLTGLPVNDPDLLALSPALVSISNSPITARPQTGVSFASIVYEMYIGEGASRFLAVFYGDFPPEQTCSDAGDCQPTHIGPIRSGRLPYESLRELFRGFLVFGSASDFVLPHLEERNIVFGQEGAEDSNTAFITPQELKSIAADTVTRRGHPAPLGLHFDPHPPDGGQPAQRIWVPYHYTDQVFWEYDTDTGVWLRSQADENGAVTLSEDRLTGSPLAFENVVVLFAQHRFFTGTFFDIDLLYITRLPALIFRDGRMYEAYWTTASQQYERTTGRLRPPRFVDAQGNPFPLKNGHTWIMIVPLFTAYNETVDSFVYRDLRAGAQSGSGNWAIQFSPPAIGGWPTPTPPP
jgi:hypothetical protein